MSWNRFNRPHQLTLIWFLICSLIFTFQSCRDLGSDPSSLVLSSWLKHWMKGPIFLIFLHKQDLQKMIHPKFWITLISASLSAEGTEWCTFIWEQHLHVQTTRLSSSLPLPRQSNSIPQNFLPFSHTTGDLWSSNASSKLFSLTLAVLCSDNHSM